MIARVAANRRKALHELADLLADLLEMRENAEAVGQRPAASATANACRPKPRRSKAPPLPRPVDRTVVVSELNRARARQALLRRGILLPKGDDGAEGER